MDTLSLKLDHLVKTIDEARENNTYRLEAEKVQIEYLFYENWLASQTGLHATEFIYHLKQIQELQSRHEYLHSRYIEEWNGLKKRLWADYSQNVRKFVVESQRV